MVERLDGEDEQPQHNFESRESIGLDGIQIELQDFKNTEFPKPKDTVAAGESEDNFVIYGKIGTREVARKLNVP
jgi:hypothetical protein